MITDQQLEEIRQRQIALDHANKQNMREIDSHQRFHHTHSQKAITRQQKLNLDKLAESLEDRYSKIDKFLAKEVGNESFSAFLFAVSREMNRPAK